MLIGFLCNFSNVFAQQDSMVSQFWKRDPNLDSENTVSNQKQIITREQILYSGYTLVSDVLQLVDGWTLSTWNGDRWNSQNGVGNYQSQNWTLMLNGQRIELMKLDAVHINMIGITVADIERIEVVNVAGNYLGEWNDKGIIHIITRKNAEGLSFRGFGSNGNEIGDPHLNVVNNPALNVNQYGAVLGGSIGFRKNKWNIQLNQLLFDYSYRDTSDFIFPLVQQYNPTTPSGSTLYSGSMQVSYSSATTTHLFTGILTRADDVVMPAGIFNPVTGRNNYNFIGYTLRHTLPKGVLQYRGGFQKRTFIATDQILYSHEQFYQTNNLNYTTRKNSSKGDRIRQLGIGYDYTTTRLTDTIGDATAAHLIRPYYSITYPLTKKSTVFSDLSVATNTKTVVPKLVLGYYKQPSIITNWSFVASFTQRGMAENNSYFTMLPLIDTSSVSFADQISGSGTLDYYFNLNVSKYFRVSFNSGLKHLFNELYFKPIPVLNTSNPLLLNTEIDKMQQTRWVNRLNVHYDMLKNTRFDVNYLRTNVFGNEWVGQNSIPRHRFSFILLQTLPARLNIWVRYYYQSSSFWINPVLMSPQANTGSQPLYTQLSSLHTVDLGVTKRLFKNYLVTSLSLRNVLNGSEQYQVNGAVFYMSLFLSVRVNIDGLFANGDANP